MWRNLWETHTGKVCGAGAGLFFGIIYLFFGFWNMLVFMFLLGIGFWIGSRADRGEELIPLGPVYDWFRSRKRRLK
ncbi:DUF2273 domain-containing protein [Paenibacillus gansuensis]|uniref:DUF2273 domain-containing protein n=1 Tax=Paenibacillus gansuensis TaxID=306542 RepID=A0ABW5PAD6_9BACL